MCRLGMARDSVLANERTGEVPGAACRARPLILGELCRTGWFSVLLWKLLSARGADTCGTILGPSGEPTAQGDEARAEASRSKRGGQEAVCLVMHTSVLLLPELPAPLPFPLCHGLPSLLKPACLGPSETFSRSFLTAL